MFGLIGTKKGMTRVFKEDGASIPVTVIEICKSKIVQRKTPEKDGYYGIQVNYGSKKKVSKSLEKKFKDNDASNGYLTEFNLTEEEFNKLAEVNELSVDFFDESLKVDVSGVSKGKGFAGVVKRHNFKTQDATHGNSLSHRALGSTGQCQDPGRVFKGKKMPGQLGNVKNTIQNLIIVRIIEEDNVILIKGSIPGHDGAKVVIKHTRKKYTLKKVLSEDLSPQSDSQSSIESNSSPSETKSASSNKEESSKIEATEEAAPIEEATKTTPPSKTETN